MDFSEDKNYYEILKIDKDATINDIMKAYIKETIENRNGSYLLLKEIEEARIVLSDTEKRQKYDEFLENINKNNEVSYGDYISEEQDIIEPVQEVSSQESIENSEIEVKDLENTQKNDDNLENTAKNNEMSTSDSIQDEQNRIQSTPVPTEILFPSPMENIEIKEDYDENNLYQQKEGSKIKSTLINGGKAIAGFAVTTPIVVFGTSWNLLKKGKCRLQKNSSHKTITGSKTEESSLIREYNRKLEENINKCLKEKHRNFDLEINRLRYENKIELTKKVIEHKKDELIKKGKDIRQLFRINSLQAELEFAQKKLERINEKIENNIKENKLYTINTRLEDIENKLEYKKQENKNNWLIVKNLKLKKSFYALKQKSSANKIKLVNGFVSGPRNIIIKAYGVAVTIKEGIDNLFTDNDIPRNLEQEGFGMARR